MADDDVLEQARAAGLTIATGVARMGDTFIRAAQQRAEADVRDKQLQVEDAQRRYEAQAQVAEQLYARASDPDWMRSVDQPEALRVWEAAQIWADLDQERFRDAADNVTTAYRQAYGTDPAIALEETRGHPMAPSDVEYDSPEARSQRAGALVDAGWPAGARHARVLADQLNAHDPPVASMRPDPASTVKAQRGRVVHQQRQRMETHER
jgi:hypothetical protein